MGRPGHFVDVGGMRMYYEERGKGEPLLLLHGGTATAESFYRQAPVLAKHFRVLIPERRGHGRTPDVEGPYSYDLMTEDVIGFMDALELSSAHVVGWSDGGIIALYLAIKSPERVRKLVAIGAHYSLSGCTEDFLGQIRQSTPETYPPLMVEWYKELSPDGPDHWPIVFEKIKTMWLHEPTLRVEDVARIEAPTLVMAGDRDVVTLEHLIDLYRAIPRAKLCILPGAAHMAPIENARVVNRHLLNFLQARMPVA